MALEDAQTRLFQAQAMAEALLVLILHKELQVEIHRIFLMVAQVVALVAQQWRLAAMVGFQAAVAVAVAALLAASAAVADMGVLW